MGPEIFGTNEEDMDIEEKWEKALSKTEILRSRLRELLTFQPTDLPYIFLGESAINVGDTVVRRGKVIIDKPLLILPPHYPQFEGFNFQKDLESNEERIRTFLLLRGLSFPSLKYTNEISSLEIQEGGLDKVSKKFNLVLEREEDVQTGLILGPEDCWQFSVIIYTGSLMLKSASGDIKRILEKFRKRGR
ncbi:MAG: hypothetical protein B5M48_03630 [Candidatus Omnitrophica bacterium 4484_213]|nr:MAG: hypothetical protein B5M48_03630 [Candidatus Omnitrophica bacterium 4484_213]